MIYELIDEIRVVQVIGHALEQKHGIKFTVFEVSFNDPEIINWRIDSGPAEPSPHTLQRLRGDFDRFVTQLKPLVTRIAAWEKAVKQQSDVFCQELDELADQIGE